MNENRDDFGHKDERLTRKGKSWVRTLIGCILILVLGIVGGNYIKKTAPQAQKRPPERTVAQVNTQPLFTGTHQVVVSAMGSVVPAREITIKSRVPGKIQSVHPEFVEGGLIRAGQTILTIEAKDYELAIARRESAVVSAEYALKMEMGYQEVAQREWDLLNRGKPAADEDVELALRKPHLAKVRSDLAAARAELEQARLDLSRTEVVAPFNTMVRKKHVAVGSQVTGQDDLAELVGTDDYWIQVSLPVERLAWIRIPRDNKEKGAAVTVFYRGYQRQGTVARLLGDLEVQGRMARLLVAVKDPLGLSDKTPSEIPPMLIGEYVRVEIQGQRLTDVYRIPRSALRDNETVWILSDDDTLKIVPVETVWRDADFVLMKNGIRSGQRLIVSDLSAPVEGLPLSERNAGSSDRTVTTPLSKATSDE